MPDLFSINTIPSPEAAYCLGGIISSAEVHECADDRTAWILPIRHNPKQVSEQQLKLHQATINKIVTACSGSILSKQSQEYKKWFPQNKEGFAAVFYSNNQIEYNTLFSDINNLLSTASDTFKRIFLVGVFDGRCSWDKHAKKIVLDCNNHESAALFCRLLESYGIGYDYNMARDRKTGGFPRQPQLRILAQNVPLFMKNIGLISLARVQAIGSSMQGQALHHLDDNILPGLITLHGLRLSKSAMEIPKLPLALLEQTIQDDHFFQDEIAKTKITKNQPKPAYSGRPKERTKILQSSQKSESYPRNKAVSLNALCIADYKCEFSNEHPTFIRRRDALPYTEPHHLIPLEYYGCFDVSLDIEENIVSLCSNCHNQLHYGEDIELILEPLFESRKQLLAYAGLLITYEELLRMYKNTY